MNVAHTLKTLPYYFNAVKAGDKTFEIRDNSDRGFQKGDIINLQKWESGYAHNEGVLVQITYVTNYQQKDNYVVFGFRVINRAVKFRG